MTGEIVSKIDGRLVFGDAVARVAETLSPFSAAARAVTEVAAVAVQVRELQLEGKRIEAEQMEALLQLKHRHSHVNGSLQDMHRTVNRTDVIAREHLALIGAAQKKILADVPAADKEIYLRLIEMHSTTLTTNHVQGGSMLTAQIHEVLNGDGAVGPNRSRPSSPGGPGSGNPGRRQNGGNGRNRSRRSR